MSTAPAALPPSAEPPRVAAADRPAPAKQLDSTALPCGGRFIQIRRNGEAHRLQATRLGKLILTR